MSERPVDGSGAARFTLSVEPTLAVITTAFFFSLFHVGLLSAH